MANITRFDPFSDLDDLLQGFFVRPMQLEGRTPVQFKMDVKEDDKGYTIHAELPGVKKEDIHVTVEGNQVSITAETKREKEEKQGEKVLRSERHYGKLSRAFTLGSELDEAGASARFNDGVLELKLPKKAMAAAKRLSVQ
ncbi:MAG TPA: Hsp20/alpha crystallin family protein [Pelomicrobium sp.]|nr:Hsp20/alpha crystallin family protein [Pelomicrobium sp.]